MKIRKSTGFILGIIFLLVQVGLIVYARFIPERFFCWAPYDEHSYMEVQVKINDRQLTPSEIESRYRYRAIGWEKRAIDNVFLIIKNYETTYGANDNADVLVKYTINGREEKVWHLKR